VEVLLGLAGRDLEAHVHLWVEGDVRVVGRVLRAAARQVRGRAKAHRVPGYAFCVGCVGGGMGMGVWGGAVRAGVRMPASRCVAPCQARSSAGSASNGLPTTRLPGVM